VKEIHAVINPQVNDRGVNRFTPLNSAALALSEAFGFAAMYRCHVRIIAIHTSAAQIDHLHDRLRIGA
jgi:hypothetical protein